MKTKWMIAACMLVLGLAVAGGAVAGDDAAKAAEKRAEIDAVAKEALDAVLSESANARTLYADAYGWAVFDNLKFALGVSGGGGSGVAVAKDGSERTYMRMGTAGVGLGLGGQKYQVVFLFENEKVFRSFVDKGWKAETGAQAAAGTEGVSAAATFHDGLAIYKRNDKGLMASADVSGTKYWKAKKLN